MCGRCVPPAIDAQQCSIHVCDVKSDVLRMLQSHAESPEAAGRNDLEKSTFDLDLAHVVTPPTRPHLLIYRIATDASQYSVKISAHQASPRRDGAPVTVSENESRLIRNGVDLSVVTWGITSGPE